MKKLIYISLIMWGISAMSFAQDNQANEELLYCPERVDCRKGGECILIPHAGTQLLAVNLTEGSHTEKALYCFVRATAHAGGGNNSCEYNIDCKQQYGSLIYTNKDPQIAQKPTTSPISWSKGNPAVCKGPASTICPFRK